MVKWWLQRFSLIMVFGFCGLASANLNHSINRLLEKQNPHEKIGVYIENLHTQTILYSYRAERRLTPASTTKAFTAAAAYIALGPGYRYVTTISTNARVREDLHGNLYIRFSGDPTLSTLDIDRLIREVRRHGIHTIRGNVVLDETVFSGPDYGKGWGSEDILRCYGAPITGAIINSDCRQRYGVVRNPDDYAKQVVRYALINAGIHVHGHIVEGKTPHHTHVIAAHYSSSLQNILDYMLKYSDDVYANAIFKTIGHHYYLVGSYREGARAVHRILSKHFGSLFKRPRLKDGSGLSTENLISPRQLVALYRNMYEDHHLREMFMHSLAISGRSGTLLHRLRDPQLRGHVYAKTGTFASDRGGVSNLAGYIIIPGCDPIAFAVMVNNTDEHDYKAETLQDRIVELVAKHEIARRDALRAEKLHMYQERLHRIREEQIHEDKEKMHRLREEKLHREHEEHVRWEREEAHRRHERYEAKLHHEHEEHVKWEREAAHRRHERYEAKLHHEHEEHLRQEREEAHHRHERYEEKLHREHEERLHREHEEKLKHEREVHEHQEQKTSPKSTK